MTTHRILVVHDQALQRLLLAEQLTTLGHACESVDSVAKAQELLRANAFSAVIAGGALRGEHIATQLHDAARTRGTTPPPIIDSLAQPVSLAVLGACLAALLPRTIGVPAAEHAQWSLFASTSREDLRDARVALEAGDETRLRDRLHRIKGAALMLGAHAIAEACARGEALVPEGHAGALSRAIDAVTRALEDADAGAGAQASR